ncbi:glycosyltransferase family 2 protein [Halorhodospira sp. M38]|nr:glycosyltransferase family 2 protein [Halorhodospira sp. M38]
MVPVYNEEACIAPLLEEIGQALQGVCCFEVLVVDDGSTDRTTECVLAAAPSSPAPLRLIRHHHNAGQSAALVSGVRHARGMWVATLDGDGQNDPGDLPRLLDIGRDPQQGADLVAGLRARRADDWVKRFSSRLANGVRRWLLDDRVSDTGCGLKLFRRDLFLEFPRFNHMHRFLPALARRADARVATVPVNHRPRHGGASKYGVGNRLWVGIVDLCGVMWLQRRPCNPEAREEHP